MVDIHTHLLFGVDDGPKTLEESIKMIEDAIKVGFDEFYLTSHYNKGRFCNENYDKNYEILKVKCEELRFKIKLYKGNEIYLDENIDTVLKEKNFNVLWENYILVEFSPMTSVPVGENLIKKVLKAGFIPIIAHVERYTSFKGSDLMRLKKLGAKLQVNIVGDKPKHIVKLQKEGFIDFLGSDAHRVEKRSYREIQEEEKGSEKKRFIGRFFSTFFRDIFTGTWIRRNSRKSKK